ncbi:MAG: Cof-type HAD-IIB family hydrolase [Clostridia bacterium]|jgi:cof-like hydrolase|nr:HAD family phosphatase [Clostridium sp.]MEE0128060.1 Cof-type HAD-IIB family hydrolase [Clostridia bacterium]
MYKLITVDLDGTLLNKYGEVSEYTKNIIKKVTDQGILVVLASGRISESVLTIAKEIGANKYYISGNGSVLYDMQKKEIIYEKYLSKEKVLELIELCEKNSIYYNIYTESSVIAKSLNYNVAFYNYENTKKSSDKKTEINIVDDVYNYIKTLNTNKFLKMTICDENKIVFSSILRKVKDIPDIDVLEVSHMSKKKIKMGTKEVSVGYYYTEVSSKNVDKWYAIEEIMKKENIAKEEVISFGDNNNDILMIKNAGLGIAMGHSNEQVKKVAKFVTQTNDEDGVAKALENIILL